MPEIAGVETPEPAAGGCGFNPIRLVKCHAQPVILLRLSSAHLSLEEYKHSKYIKANAGVVAKRPAGESRGPMTHRQTRLSVAVFTACLTVWCSWAAGDTLTARISTDTASTTWVSFNSQLVSESEIPPPTAAFSIMQGQSFSYISFVDSLPAGQQPSPRMAILSAGFGSFPRTQRITCLGKGHRPDSTTVVLVNYAKIKNPRSLAPSNTTIPYRRRVATAYIDPVTGRIEREIRTSSVNPDHADILEGPYWDFSRTLWEFYGCWMLYLSDDFYYERVVEQPLVGPIKISLQTIRRDNLANCECFVVRFRRGSPGGDGIEKTYLVDTQDRVVVQVKDDQFVLKLVVPEKRSAGEER